MVSVAVATLGCKVNQYESAGMLERLQGEGFRLASFDGAVDLYIINTCTVTAKSDYQSRQLIRRAGRLNPQAAICVTGCYAQVAPEHVASIPGVAMVAGNEEKKDIFPLVRELVRGGGGAKEICVSDMRQVKEFSTPAVGVFPGHTRAFLKIQDGCDAFCNYCIVPYARGRARSLPEREVLDRITALDKAGYREAVLTGINLGAHGRDLRPKTGLPTLLRSIAQQRPSLRFRLSSLEPREITPDLLSLMGNSEIWCRHFHIPFQSGDDGILSRMGRDYHAAFFNDLTGEILTCLPDAAIGLDVMVGFPGEGEREFLNTRQLIEALPVAYLHVFPFSPRPGTPAASLSGQVSESEKKKRASDLRQMGKRKKEVFALKFVGKELPVLLETKRDSKTGFLQGFSSNYIPVLVANGDAVSINEVVRVIAEEAREGKLIGRMVT